MQGDSALGRALALVRELRARCPWDGAQTRGTLRPYLVEEVLELDQALRDDDPVALRDELDAEAVTHGLEEKMRRRHPHLFGGGGKPASWELGKRESGTGKQETLR